MRIGKRLIKAMTAVVVTLIALQALHHLVIRPWQLRWGATGDEAGDGLPGDDLVEAADLTATRAITIGAFPERVWPWLVQIGQGRGGFYSYDGLENLAGCEIHSADQIIPEWQELQPGDEVRLHPEIALHVAQVEPGRALVLYGEPVFDDEMSFRFSWAFVLRPMHDGRTRLLIRERYGYSNPAAGQLIEAVSLASFVMTRKMLMGIRDRAERVAA